MQMKLSLILCAVAIAQAGTKKITVEDSLTIHRVAAPRFSPDGNWILYTETEWDRKNDRQVSHLFVARAGSTPVKLTAGEKGEMSPQWAPDGSRIAFLADRAAADAKNGNQIWIIRPNGGEAEKLTSEESAIKEFQWSPDGKRLAFVVSDTPKDKTDRDRRKKDKFDAILVDAGYNYSHLWTINRWTELRKSASPKARSPSPTRAGRPIRNPSPTSSPAWARRKARSSTSMRTATPTSTSSAPRAALPVASPRTPVPIPVPAWSPDGSEITYLSAMDPRSWAEKVDMMVMPAAGGSPKDLTQDFPDSATSPKWAPDGKSVYWDSEEGVHRHIFRVSTSGGKIVHITEGAMIYADFDISPDGARIATSIDNSSQPLRNLDP